MYNTKSKKISYIFSHTNWIFTISVVQFLVYMMSSKTTHKFVAIVLIFVTLNTLQNVTSGVSKWKILSSKQSLFHRFFLQKTMLIDFQNYSYTFDEVYMIGSFLAKKDILNVQLTVLKTVPRFELFLHGQISSFGTNNYRDLVRRTFNMCNFLQYPNKEYVFNTIYQYLLKNGNFVKKCPVEPVSLGVKYVDEIIKFLMLFLRVLLQLIMCH